MKRKTSLKVIALFSFIAVLISAFLLYQHFSTEVSKFCNFGDSFSCDIVNKGEYSTVDGVTNLALGLVFKQNFYLNFPVPNAVVSMLVFFFFFVAAGRMYYKKSLFGMHEKALVRILRNIMIISILYAIFLIYIEAAVLQTWCIFCLALDGAMIIIAYALFAMEGKS